MSISIWRYSHLALAVSSFIFIFLATVTGIILALEPISEQLQPYKVSGYKEVPLAQTMGILKQDYDEVLSLQIDANGFVLIEAITTEGDTVNGYINPATGAFLGHKIERSKFFQFITNFHRSLFLKGLGRFFVGLCSFFLFLIAISGTLLILKRQQGVKAFFSKIVDQDFNQYWHVVLGRLSLLPIIIITLTGVYLSLERFNMLPEVRSTHVIDFETILDAPQQALTDFSFFKNTTLKDVKAVEFPFSSDVEDYFTVKLKHKEVAINQYTGSVLSEIQYPLVAFLSSLSLNLHTGKGSIVWSVILAIACANILFFIYSGFAMTFKRRAAKLNNKYKKQECEYIVLVGSENGGSLPFANAFYKALIKAGKTVYITYLNHYSMFKKAKHLVVITSTYGEGEAPSNANKFLKLIKEETTNAHISYTVLGFGSLAYPQFCQFAYDADKALSSVFKQMLPTFTINDKSVEAFNYWVNQWSNATGLKITIPKQDLQAVPLKLKKLKVVSKTLTNIDKTFLITLKPKGLLQFTSGDLLVIYPKNNHKERWYSIGKVNGTMQLSVKLHDYGLGSGFLHKAEPGSAFKARLVKNTAFHLPRKAKRVIMIANGTGIAPFLGMLHQNIKGVETHLYYGLRQEKSYKLYKSSLSEYVKKGRLKKVHKAFSQQGDKKYVQDLVLRDAAFFAETLKIGGVVMICGSMNMHKGVLSVLETIVATYNKKPLSYYQKQQQIKSDCY